MLGVELPSCNKAANCRLRKAFLQQPEHVRRSRGPGGLAGVAILLTLLPLFLQLNCGSSEENFQVARAAPVVILRASKRCLLQGPATNSAAAAGGRPGTSALS